MRGTLRQIRRMRKWPSLFRNLWIMARQIDRGENALLVYVDHRTHTAWITEAGTCEGCRKAMWKALRDKALLIWPPE